jgi:thioredoxin 1
MIDELAREMAGQATIGKVNVEAEPAIAARFGVQALPSLLFFKGGQRVETLVGRVPKAVLADRLRKLRE